MKTIDRPVPVADVLTQPYWDAASRDELLLQHCSDCKSFQFYPRALCVHCGSDRIGWQKAAGAGTVYSYTVNHRPAGPWAADRVPYVIALIDLTEGPRLMANINVPGTEIAVGDAVIVWFEEIAPGWKLPQFRPLERAHSEEGERDGVRHR